MSIDSINAFGKKFENSSMWLGEMGLRESCRLEKLRTIFLFPAR